MHDETSKIAGKMEVCRRVMGGAGLEIRIVDQPVLVYLCINISISMNLVLLCVAYQ